MTNFNTAPQAQVLSIGGVLSSSAPVLPYERRFLGAALTQGFTHDYGITPEMFLTPRHQTIWSGIVNTISQGFLPEAGTLLAWAESQGKASIVGGHSYLHEVLRGDSATFNSNLDECCLRIVEAYQARKLREAHIEAIRAIDEASFAEKSFHAIASESESLVFEATRHLAVGNIFESVADSAISYQAEYEKRAALGGKPVGIPIGFSKLDEILGGLQKGDLVGLMGGSGSGKTAFVTSCLEYLSSRKVEVAIFSLEMNRTSLIDRIIAASSEGGVPLKAVKTAHDDYSERMRAQVLGLNSMDSIHISEKPSMTISQIESACRRLIAENGRLDQIIIDHVHLIKSDRRDSSSQGEGDSGRVSRQLKELAQELNINIIGLLQENSESSNRKDKRPLLSDMKYRMTPDFDVVLAVHRPEYHDPETELKGIAEIYVLKNRNGETGVARMQYAKEFTRFSSMSRTDASDMIVLPHEVEGEIQRLKQEAERKAAAERAESNVDEVVSLADEITFDDTPVEFESPGNLDDLDDFPEEVFVGGDDPPLLSVLPPPRQCSSINDFLLTLETSQNPSNQVPPDE